MDEIPGPIPLDIVDAFADAAFSGNPAAVCLLEQPGDAVWMQRVAGEMNLSETAFVEPRAEGFGLRWFTPTVEVELCGHATLAAAHVLWERELVPQAQTIRFFTLSGVLTARRSGVWIELDFPMELALASAAPAGLAEALGARLVGAYRNRMDWLVELESVQAVRELRPDFLRLAGLPARVVIVTAQGGDACDFVSRCFAPAVGIDEDPVTGSAHCALGPFWAARLGKRSLVGRQISRRGGIVRVEVLGTRVLLSGTALTVLRGGLTVAPAGSGA